MRFALVSDQGCCRCRRVGRGGEVGGEVVRQVLTAVRVVEVRQAEYLAAGLTRKRGGRLADAFNASRTNVFTLLDAGGLSQTPSCGCPFGVLKLWTVGIIDTCQSNVRQSVYRVRSWLWKRSFLFACLHSRYARSAQLRMAAVCSYVRPIAHPKSQPGRPRDCSGGLSPVQGDRNYDGPE